MNWPSFFAGAIAAVVFGALYFVWSLHVMGKQIDEERGNRIKHEN